MAYWLATGLDGQETDFIQRFDPRFWTVDFPRPMMASVVSTAPDALRVDCEFHHCDALAGLIWESEDRYDHPLLGYDTQRDYAHTSLSFHWRSGGVLPLDTVHGPTLTIEGRDAAGNARTWYVRLWNYASGNPDDATIILPFSDLREGWLADGALVHPLDIDRIFISLAPMDYDPADTGLLIARANGWIELQDITCDGAGAILTIGDPVLPAHGLGMATAYDDSYNLTPARLLRNTLHLGYRGSLVHYVGMSHYYRLVQQADGSLLPSAGDGLCDPCMAWHADFFARCQQLDFEPILSISYELFDEHCPSAWKQRSFAGAPALTGWVPPSTLLSPASDEAMAFLRQMALDFVDLMMTAGVSVVVQIGEPWWWVTAEDEICLYDDAAMQLQPAAAQIEDLSGPLDADQLALLDWAGSQLATSTNDLRDAIRAHAAGAAKVLLLLFTPTILDPARPELQRANMPAGWAWPAYDRLQLEDYDWLAHGAEALRLKAYDFVQQHLNYPIGKQEYLAGFVLQPSDAEEFWPRIDAGIDDAIGRGILRSFIWALPQVLRDGYVRLPYQENDVQAFDDLIYPLALGQDTGVSPEFSTTISLTASGHERRNSQWSDARLHYDVGPGIRSHSELGVLLEFFRARRGPARGFRLSDPFDFSTNGLTGSPTMMDQPLGTGDGLTATYRLCKFYGSGTDAQKRFITRPRTQTLLVSVDGLPNTNWHYELGGKIIFTDAPAMGAKLRCGFLFDVPVRFAEDRLDITNATFAAGDAPSVPLIELREDV